MYQVDLCYTDRGRHNPEDKSAAELRANECRGMIQIHQSMIKIEISFLELDLQATCTPSLERSIKKMKVQSDSSDSRDSDYQHEAASSNQQMVYQKGQPIATPILIYEDTRREVVQQCMANLMSTFCVYPYSEVIASSFTDRFEDLLR